jgi:16S rRNA (uracil1498-N3)-methyltransferase
MARHRILIQTPPLPLAPGPLVVEGDEAHHAARVKRLQPGDALEVLDGRGMVGDALVAQITKERGVWRMSLEVRAVRREEPVRPRLEVCCPAPKGPRLADMIDGLSQAGAAAWMPLETARAITEPRAGKLERLDRTALEAAKQCGRAWVLEIGEAITLEAALREGGLVLVADASGGTYQKTGAARIRLLLGPEGGWTDQELASARAAGASIASFGPHVMRIETAAVVATGVILDRERT